MSSNAKATKIDWRERDQLTLAPRDRTDTLEAWDGVTPTLGFQVIAWIYDNLKHVNGPRAGKPFQLTPRQALFIVKFYELEPDGTFKHVNATRRLAKGSGKSPFAAVHAVAELLGPVKFDHFDPEAPGGAVGIPEPAPWVQIIAVSLEQTKNTMKIVRQLMPKDSPLADKYDLDIQKTKIEIDGARGLLEQITSSPESMEGNSPTFAILDETEHWVGERGVKLFEAVKDNLAKLGGRFVETCNAWEPNLNSIAERNFEDWCLFHEGKSNAEKPNLYDAKIAPPNTVFGAPGEGEISLDDALAYVYADASWVNIDTVKAAILTPTASAATSRRKYLNQPSTRSGAWVSHEQWARLIDTERELVEGEDIVMFFDGSKSDDTTALVACCMSDGFVFPIGVWEPQPIADGKKIIDYQDVNRTVLNVKDKFNVIGFWADMTLWQSYVADEWPRHFEDTIRYPVSPSGGYSTMIAFDMRGGNSGKQIQFAKAVEYTYMEIVEGRFSHNGDPVLSQHVTNAVAYPLKKWVSIAKDSGNSPRKIDAAVCMVGARMLYHHVKSDPNYDGSHTDFSSDYMFL
ncbi:terminase [Corynebacterium minutissimum]|uniref:Putative phage terminase n=1 Tax=Corynebacterium minutissimum TaxID=38301 RepID=A0A376CWA5_9CORY|nr:terminase [Corynebacterium minutissimum]QRP60682.1 terminase [Corynebacterium minutissimum]STC76800.1 putative phage terminase [Corynebacterium minutissimum]